MTPSNRQFGRRSALGLGLILLLAGCSGLSQQWTQAWQAQRSFHDGLAHYEAKDYRGAIPYFARALAEEPDFDEAGAYLAWSYYYVGDYVQATRHFRQALARQPRWEGLHTGLGWSRYRVGRYHLALEAFQAALAINHRYRNAAVGRAYALFELGRYAEALPQLERLTRESAFYFPDGNSDVEEVRSRYAWCLYYTGGYQEAHAEFAKGIQAHPKREGLHNGLGWTYLKLGDRDKARESFQRALQLDPDYADARAGLAEASR